jgi:hypothetical protein
VTRPHPKDRERILTLWLNGMCVVQLLCAERCHELTRRYVARRTAEGKSEREIRRCLKRTVARQLFGLLERHAPTRVTV